MIYLLMIALGLSYLAGRSPFKCFDHVRFRYPFLLIGALLLQIILFVVFRLHPVRFSYLLEMTVLLLLAGLWFNRNIAGIHAIALGCTLNLLAVIFHHGRMPVLEQSLRIAGLTDIPDDARHQLVTESLFWWLGDWIPLYKMVISIGDLCVGAGMMIFIFKNSPLRRKNETD